MMASQSCGLSVAHPWLMLWKLLVSSNNISQACSPCSAMVKVILASSACSMRDRSDSHCLFILVSLDFQERAFRSRFIPTLISTKRMRCVVHHKETDLRGDGALLWCRD